MQHETGKHTAYYSWSSPEPGTFQVVSLATAEMPRSFQSLSSKVSPLACLLHFTKRLQSHGNQNFREIGASGGVESKDWVFSPHEPKLAKVVLLFRKIRVPRLDFRPFRSQHTSLRLTSTGKDWRTDDAHRKKNMRYQLYSFTTTMIALNIYTWRESQSPEKKNSKISE